MQTSAVVNQTEETPKSQIKYSTPLELLSAMTYFVNMTQTRILLTALATIAMLVALIAGCGREPETFDELKATGKKAFVAENYMEARKYLSKAVAMQPSDREVLFFLGSSYERDFLYDSAQIYLKRVDILYPGDRETNQGLYKVCRSIADWKNTIKAIGVLVATGDDIKQYQKELVNLHLQLGQPSQANYYLASLLEREPDQPNWHLMSANVAAQMDSMDVALARIDVAIEKFGALDEFIVNRGIFLVAKKKYVTAENIFRELCAKDTSSVPFRLNLANALASQDVIAKKQEAYQIYEILLPLMTDDIFALDSMMTVLADELNLR